MIKKVFVQNDWTKKHHTTIKHNLDTITYRILKKVGEIVRDELKNEIETGVFDTLNPEIKANGLKYKGDYLDSIKSVPKKVGTGHSEVSIGSTDDKALLVEYGGGPRMYADLKDETMIEWAREKGLPVPHITGKRIAAKIRRMGTVAKPVFRRTIQKLQFEGIIEGVKEQEAKLLKRPEGID